jgi:hypothetical protein
VSPTGPPDVDIISPKEAKRLGLKDNMVKTHQISIVTQTVNDKFFSQVIEPCAGGYVVANWGSPTPEKWKSVPFYEFEDLDDKACLYVCPFDDAVDKGAVLLPKNFEVASSVFGVFPEAGELLKEIMEFAREYVDLPEEDMLLASAYVMLSYLQDSFNALPFLRFRGDTGSGKTRALYVFGTLCYKVLCAGGSATPAGMRRLLDKWRGSLAIDEADFNRSDERQDVTKMLNARNECGEFSNYIACDKNDPRNVDVLRLFGATVLATRKSFDDKALEGRCLTINMKETSRTDIPVNLPPEFNITREWLRCKLTVFRISKMAQAWEPEPLDKEAWGSLENMEPRLKQVFEPMMQMMGEDRGVLMEFMERHRRNIVEERAGSWTGMVVSAVFTLLDEVDDPSAKDIVEQLKTMGYEKATPQGVGKELRALGIRASRSMKRRFYDFTDKENWEAYTVALRRYIPDLPEPDPPRPIAEQSTLTEGA